MNQSAAAPSGSFPDMLRLRVPRNFGAALKLLARRHNTLPSEWARQALLRCMKAEGVSLDAGRIVETAPPAPKRGART